MLITRRLMVLLALAALLLLPAARAGAQEGGDGGGEDNAELQALQESFRQRYPQLQELKTQGQVGETWEGYVATVVASPSERARQVVEEENADRRRLYTILAEQEDTTAERVARRNAVRNFEKARSGEYLRGEDGQWTQK